MVSDHRRFNKLVVLLPPELYQRLQALAEREDRVPDQQAAHILRLALSQLPQPKPDGPI